MPYNVYKITNTVDGKVYVGSTTCHIEVRWHQHMTAALGPNRKPYPPCQALCLAIREYGKEKFALELLEECATKKIMLGRERHWMEQLSSFQPNGYNVPTIKRLMDEQVAIIRFNALNVSRKEYARLFGVSDTSVFIAQKGYGNESHSDPYDYIAPEHLPPDLDLYMRRYTTPEEEASDSPIVTENACHD